MGEPLVSIITPTFRRDLPIIERSLNSVSAQTYPHWEQIICSDGVWEPQVQDLIERRNDPRFRYLVSGQNYGNYGSGVRQEMMMTQAQGDYLVFLDDDNIIFPTYLEKMLKALRQADHGAKLAICEILHFGPLQDFWGPPPVILPGELKVYYIDTLQILIEKQAMQAVGWLDHSYFADGHTYEELGRRYLSVRVPECLGVHF